MADGTNAPAHPLIVGDGVVWRHGNHGRAGCVFKVLGKTTRVCCPTGTLVNVRTDKLVSVKSLLAKIRGTNG